VDGAQGNYFAVVSTYIHLNPARAGLIRIGAERLASYRWSSYPWYLRASPERAAWFESGRVLGNLGLGPHGAKGYGAYIEGRVLELGIKQGRQELAEEWKTIRRGWYLGGAAFRERMLALAEGPLRRGQRSSYSGGAKREHGEAEAERLLARGLAVLKLEASRLAERPKGGLQKQLLAWWLCQHTTARRRWVSERLGMGDESRVTQAIDWIKQQVEPEVKSLRKRLEEAYESTAPTAI
jgi:putative transposase